jgi:hypothetical protein
VGVVLLLDLTTNCAYRTTCHSTLRTLLLQKRVGTTSQRPEAQYARLAHHLIMVAAEQFLEVIEEGFDLPTDR